MRLCQFVSCAFLISVAVPSLLRGQVHLPPIAAPTYIRKLQSDKDVNPPSRVEQFAFHMSGYASREDRTVDHREQWDVDPTKYPDEILIDSPHFVRSTRSLPKTPAISSFGTAISSPFSSHELFMARPSAVTTDVGDRIIVCDPQARAVHMFDLRSNRYLRIQGGKGMRLQSPSGVAVDASHNLYVTDMELGLILVYDELGKFQRYIGVRENGEGGIFYQPSSIAIDQDKGRIYVPDTSRHVIVVMNLNGKLLEYLGRPDLASIRLRQRNGGVQEKGKIQSPTEVFIRTGQLYVLGISRVQIFDLDGKFQTEFPLLEAIYSEAAGLAVDSQQHIYVSDLLHGTVLVYDCRGHLLYSFGRPGSKHKEFSQPRGLWIDKEDRIYVADSINGRVQVFQLHEDSATSH